MAFSFRWAGIRRRLWAILKWTMFLAVLFYVARHGYALWNKAERATMPISWGWLALAAVSSVAAWLPSVWYWRRLMARMGKTAPWPQVFRAYYCGHLGKYVPGKAAVFVIRAALLKDAGVAAVISALSVLVKSLTDIWAGAIVALLLFPIEARRLPEHWPEWIAVGAQDLLGPFGVAAIVAAVGAFALISIIWWNHRVQGFFIAGGGLPMTSAGSLMRMIFEGALVFLPAWWIQGLTLGLVIRAFSSGPWVWGDWPFWTGTAAAAIVGGFLVLFAPGGLGVREGLLMELLAPQLGPHQAVVVALAWRGVSLAGEILAAGALYYAVAGAKTENASAA